MEQLKAQDHFIYFPSEDKDFFTDLCTKKDYSSVFVLVDTNTEKHCLPYFLSNYPMDYGVEVISIDAGEEHKHLQTCLGVWEALSELGADRNSLLINLGGGVVTDLGGFVASTFKRGIDFINIPTTLLSMVDASVGGKTGVDLGVLKNQVGVIVNPQGVVVDPTFLATLPANEYRSGYAEMLKHGLIQDRNYWEQLADFKAINTNEIGHYIAHSVGIKQKVVAQDPFEKNLRKMLNFGHTLGHAIESYFLVQEDKTTLLHGEAIAIGMILEAFISNNICGMPFEECDAVKKVFNSIFPLVEFTTEDIVEIEKLLIFDKKNSHGRVRYALLEKIGKPHLDAEVSPDLIREAFSYYQKN